MLSSAVRELSDIVEHMGPSPGCKKCSGGSEEAATVEFKLHATNESYDKLVILARQSEVRLRSKEEEILELKSKVNSFSNHHYYLRYICFPVQIFPALNNRGQIEIRRGREGDGQAGLGGVKSRQGRGHQEGVGDERHGREEEERLRGGASQRADSGDAGMYRTEMKAEVFPRQVLNPHSPLLSRQSYLRRQLSSVS